MSNAIFPKLRGLKWGMETAIASTRIPKHVSGREVRFQLFKHPLYEIELPIVGLSASKRATDWNFDPQSLQTLQAFWSNRAGSFDPFCLKKADYTGDPCDSRVEGGLIGVGDGTNKQFTFLRFLPSNSVGNPPYQEPIGQVEPLGLNVYVDGVAQVLGTNYAVWSNAAEQVNQVIIYNWSGGGGAAPPPAGSKITADYTFYWKVRFSEDTLAVNNIALYLWEHKGLKFQTVRVP